MIIICGLLSLTELLNSVAIINQNVTQHLHIQTSLYRLPPCTHLLKTTRQTKNQWAFCKTTSTKVAVNYMSKFIYIYIHSVNIFIHLQYNNQNITICEIVSLILYGNNLQIKIWKKTTPENGYIFLNHLEKKIQAILICFSDKPQNINCTTREL